MPSCTHLPTCLVQPKQDHDKEFQHETYECHMQNKQTCSPSKRLNLCVVVYVYIYLCSKTPTNIMQN